MSIKQSSFTIFSCKNTIAIDACKYQPITFSTVFRRNVIIFLIDIKYLMTVEITFNKNLIAFHTAYINILFKQTSITTQFFCS